MTGIAQFRHSVQLNRFHQTLNQQTKASIY